MDVWCVDLKMQWRIGISKSHVHRLKSALWRAKTLYLVFERTTKITRATQQFKGGIDRPQECSVLDMLGRLPISAMIGEVLSQDPRKDGMYYIRILVSLIINEICTWDIVALKNH